MLDISGYELSPWPASGWSYKLYTGDLVNVGFVAGCCLFGEWQQIWTESFHCRLPFSAFFSALTQTTRKFHSKRFPIGWDHGLMEPSSLLDCALIMGYICVSVITKSLYIIVEQHWATINQIHKSHQIKPHMFPGKTFATYGPLRQVGKLQERVLLPRLQDTAAILRRRGGAGGAPTVAFKRWGPKMGLKKCVKITFW